MSWGSAPAGFRFDSWPHPAESLSAFLRENSLGAVSLELLRLQTDKITPGAFLPEPQQTTRPRSRASTTYRRLANEVQYPAQARGSRQHHQPGRRSCFHSVAEGRARLDPAHGD